MNKNLELKFHCWMKVNRYLDYMVFMPWKVIYLRLRFTPNSCGYLTQLSQIVNLFRFFFSFPEKAPIKRKQ